MIDKRMNIKNSFRDFSLWFLENRAVRYIVAKNSKIKE